MSVGDLGFVCCPSGKVAYPTEREASAELRRLKRRGPRGRRQGKVEHHVYACPVIGCGAWHLSAMDVKRPRRRA